MKTRPTYSSFIIGIAFIMSAFTVQAQMAPDFTVTDSDGNQHVLYQDYLDQDKTVMLKFFFTTCPPCIAIAPSVEELYQEWGAGANDVEFIEISVLSSDTDAKINTYKNNLFLTFPGVGPEGGGMEALEPYQNGTFGSFTATPLFAVIAPDGSVNFDVFGPGINGQIDSLDAALLATGAMKPGMIDTMDMDTTMVDTMMTDTMMMDSMAVEPIEIEAAVFFAKDSIPMQNVQVRLYATEEEDAVLIDSFMTDENGQVNFEVFQDSIPEKAVIRIHKDDTATRGLSGLDILVILRHLLDVEPFTAGYQYLMSDVNSSLSLSALDLLKIQKLILDVDQDFTSGPVWHWVPADVKLEDGSVPSGFRDYIKLQDVFDGQASLSFKGYKRGDLNMSVAPN